MTIPTEPAKRKHTMSGVLLGFLTSLIIVVAGLWQAQNILDWWRLRDYTPPAAISALADKTAMTERGRHLFYVNRPQILEGDAFNDRCRSEAEQSIVLGCYLSGDRGIFLFHVTDERLAGVVETTAAHEMLHAGYGRLSSREKQRVDTMLESYYQNDLADDRIKRTIDAYRQSEPKDVVNEMHSIFGTEIAELPGELEEYYRTYFSDRSAVTEMTAHYQAEFTSRRDQAREYDDQLAALKAAIETNQRELKTKRSTIDSEYDRLQQLRVNGATDTYNASVDSYNAKANAYNTLLTATQTKIDEYNAIVESRNALALETRELTQALSSQQVTTE